MVRIRNGLIFLLVTIIFALNFSVCADEVISNDDTEAIETIDTTYKSYQEYLKNNDGVSADNEIDIKAGESVDSQNAEILAEYNGIQNVIKIGESGSITYKIEVLKEAFYELEFTYLLIKGSTSDLNLTLSIDGVVPFHQAGDLNVPRLWKNNNEKRLDESGNEYAPSQIEADEFSTIRAYDNTGVETEPFRFFLTAGIHEIKISLTEESCYFSEIKFVAPTVLKAYKDVAEQYKNNGYKNSDKLITIHAENADFKSKNSLAPKSDTSSVEVFPANASCSLLNYIGGPNWSEAGDTLTWRINVEKAGLYKFAYRYSQSEVTNGYVYRTLKIDGEVPFKEAKDMSFLYTTDWIVDEFGDSEGNPYLIWLDEGEHDISLSVTLGKMSDYYRRLSDIVDVISTQYLKILMITGETPDANRDYALFENIPGLEGTFKKTYNELIKLADDMSGKSNTTKYSASLKNMARVINNMLENKYDAHRYKTDYYDQYCTVSSWLNDMKDMSLSLDEIWFTAPDVDLKTQLEENNQSYKAGFFKKIGFSVRRFLFSFTSDYSLSKGKAEGTTLKLWINWGRDQAQALNLLIRERFTPNTNINVQLELVDATLIQGMLTDNAPDIALQVARTNPVNYAMRGALYDLKNFEDFDEVCARFQDTAITPYIYGDGCYALPDTQNFYIMFYRKDILEQLGIEVPKTWDEFIAATTVLQRNNMDVCIPYTKITTAGTVNTGLGGLNLFTTFLSQNNVSIYNDDLTATKFSSADSINIFTYWSDFYTKYKVPVVMDFYNRFRLGVCPLGIGVYTTYTTLQAAAPEIEGKWGISEIPGFEQENGEINNSVCGSGTGCVILKPSKNKEAAWEFLKWWTSAETQNSFSRELETILGPTGRIATSNVEAFNLFSWKKEDKEVLLSQWSKINELPEAPGSYYLPRSVDQAFWSVYNGKKNVGDALAEWTLVADQEMLKKQKEYNYKK